MEKKFRLSVKIKKCDIVFKKELGPGIIVSQDLTFDLTPEKYESVNFALQLMNTGESLRSVVTEILTEEIK